MIGNYLVQTLQDGTITIRDRDTMKQKRIAQADAINEIETLLRESLKKD